MNTDSVSTDDSFQKMALLFRKQKNKKIPPTTALQRPGDSIVELHILHRLHTLFTTPGEPADEQVNVQYAWPRHITEKYKMVKRCHILKKKKKKT